MAFYRANLITHLHNLSMQSNTIAFNVSFGESGTVYGCGHALDTLLYSQGLYTEDEAMFNVIDYVNDSAMDALKSPDTEMAVIELLNSLEDGEAIRRLSDHDVHVTQTELTASEMLAGDYLSLERPESLDKLLGRVRAYASESWQDQPATCALHLCPSSVLESMQKSYDWSMDYARDEWLKGDRSSDGALGQLARALFGREEASISWNTKTDAVEFTASPEAVRELYSYDLGEDEPMPSPSDIAEYLKGYALTRCKAKAEEQRVKHLSVQQRRAEEDARRDNARLLAIETAKQRKQQKTA